MPQNGLAKIKVLKEPGAIFSSDVSTDYIELSNYKYIDFIISSGEGDEAEVTVTVKAKDGSSGGASKIPFLLNNGSGTKFTEIKAEGANLKIGGSEGEYGHAVYRVNARMLAKYGFDRVNINVTSATGSTASGCIIAVLYSPRYSE
jgi:hypothetical protein